MSLTSLADAPLLSKPLAGPVLARSRSLSTPKHKEDQAAIDALFEEEKSTFADMQKDRTQCQRKSFPFSKELPNPERNLSLKSNTEDAVQNLHLPILPPLNQQIGDNFKKKLSKQEDTLFSKTKDANDVLAGFLADSTSSASTNRPPNLEAEKAQREEFKFKWNSFSPQPATRLPTLTFSPRLSSGSIQHTSDSSEATVSQTKSAKDYSSSSMKDGDRSTKDVLYLLPDESIKPIKKAASRVISSMSSGEFDQDEEEDSLDFGGYQPSCLSGSVSTHAMQHRHFTNFISSSENLDAKEKTTEKYVKNDSFSILNTSDQKKVNQDGGPCKKNEINELTDIWKHNPLPVQHSPAETLPLNPCSIPVTKESTTDEKQGLSVEIKRLRNENLALREEIMKIEAEKLELEKEFLEKELSNDPQGTNQEDFEREEAQKIAEELAVELLSVKQSLSLTEEKIDCMKKVHEHEVDMLKTTHKKELEMKERQLSMQETILVEKKDAMEAFSQLLSKVDGWSVRIDELHKSIVCEEGAKSSAWVGNIETMVSEHDCSLQMLEKRSTDVCNQLESVAIMLDNARKDMENLHKQEEERMSKTHIRLQAFQPNVPVPCFIWIMEQAVGLVLSLD
ncbi:hypothetical protein GOP47_0030909 [Adiantum capillus-veneris]|nr:hypothetical protein GOP47_0030909 [Adiantum capillus-veneris]